MGSLDAVQLSLSEARRIALAAQGFGQPPPDRTVDSRAITTRIVRRLGLLQLDSVNVLERAHYLPVFSRLGPYDRALLDAQAHRAPRRLFEYWGHEASLIDVRLQPALRWRMARARDEAWGGVRDVAERRPDLVAAVLAEVRTRGPLRAADLAHHEGREHVRGPWWSWSDVKRALEYLFWSGEITSARRINFERRYATAEQVLPRAVLDTPTPPVEAAQRTLIGVAARALGVATASDLRDWFRLPAAGFTDRVAELVEAGELDAVTVEGWTTQAYLAPSARLPRQIEARALLCPFDPLIWTRPRVERLFGFRYRLEIYVPAGRRVHGYYVLPFLLGDRLVARVDLKSDRAAGRLLVKAVFFEPDAPEGTADELAAALRGLAAWLALGGVSVSAAGATAGAVRTALGS